MKPQVPDILAKFYRKNDPATHLHEIRTDDLPETGTLYRDNTTGIIWKVIAHSGSDIHEPGGSYGNGFSMMATPVRRAGKARERDRLVILQSHEPEGVTMHVEAHILTSEVHSSEHYAVMQKATASIKRFEEVDGYEREDAPFWKRSVKVMDTEKIMRKLAEPSTASLYVLNVYPTPHGLADLLIEWVDPTAPVRTPKVAKIAATWLPQNLLESVPKSVLLQNQTFRRYLDGGFIQAITVNSAKRIMETPEYHAEVERRNESSPIKQYGAMGRQ